MVRSCCLAGVVVVLLLLCCQAAQSQPVPPGPELSLIPAVVPSQARFSFSSATPPPTTVTSFRWYLPKQNLGWLRAQFEAVSDPKSAQYRQFLTPEAVDAQLLPNASVVQPALDFLQAAQLGNVSYVKQDALITVSASVQQVERLFGVTLHVYPSVSRARNGTARSVIYRTPDSLSLPTALLPSLAFISGVNDVPPAVVSRNFSVPGRGPPPTSRAAKPAGRR